VPFAQVAAQLERALGRSRPVGDGDLRPLLEQRLDDGAADVAGAADDEGRAAGQVG
jgi:hypothetical protein